MKRKRTSKRTAGRSQKNRGRFWISWWVFLGLLVSAISVLLYLEIYRERLQQWIHPVPEKEEPGRAASELDKAGRLFDEHCRSVFEKAGMDSQFIMIRQHPEGLGGGTFIFKRYEVRITVKDKISELERALDLAAGSLPGATMLIRKEISGGEERTTLSLRMRERVIRQVVLIPQGEAVFQPSPSPAPFRVAIIVDDIGLSLVPVKMLLSLDQPVTFSIIPGLQHSLDAAGLIHEKKREIMLHIPMEPLNYPRKNPGDRSLTVSMDPEEIRRRVGELIQEVPYLSGVNNHMGSRFTQDRGRMSVVLEELKKRNLFFIDSLTVKNSTAYDESLRLGVKSGRRDIFLDNLDHEESVIQQIDQLIRLAKRRGYAIAICHPKESTIKALKDSMEKFRSQGVEIVPVSELIGVS